MPSDIPFKLGLVIYSSYPDVRNDPGILLRRLTDVAKDTTWDVVEVQYVDDTSYWPKIRKIAQDAGIELVASAGPACIRLGWNLSSQDPFAQMTAIEGMQRAIEFSYSIGARALVYTSGKDPGENERVKSHLALLNSVATLSDYARHHATDYILVLSLEPADRQVQHKQLIGPTAEAVVFMSQAREKSAFLGITLDMSHIAQLGETIEEATGSLKGMVTHAHIANTFVRDPTRPEYGDQHPRFGLAGSEYGMPDVTHFVETVCDRCFRSATFFPYGKPVISLEVRPAGDTDPDVLLAGAKRVFFAAMCRARIGSQALPNQI